jgi:hypothetical protein
MAGDAIDAVLQDPDDGSDDVGPRTADDGGLKGARLRAMLAELQRVYEHLERNNESPRTVIQFMILAFGAALIAAAEVPEALVAVPIFWTIWLLYSRLVDFNTLKLSLYAQYLENELNEALGKPVFFWESRVTQRGNVRPFITVINFGYWAALALVSWIAGVAVLLDQDHYVWVVAFAAAGAVLMATAIRDYQQREMVKDRLHYEIDQGPDAIDRPVVVQTDTLWLLAPALPIIVVALGGAVAISEMTSEPLATWLIGAVIVVVTSSVGTLIVFRSSTVPAVDTGARPESTTVNITRNDGPDVTEGATGDGSVQ